jgi:hypothetical protein
MIPQVNATSQEKISPRLSQAFLSLKCSLNEKQGIFDYDLIYMAPLAHQAVLWRVLYWIQEYGGEARPYMKNLATDIGCHINTVERALAYWVAVSALTRERIGSKKPYRYKVGSLLTANRNTSIYNFLHNSYCKFKRKDTSIYRPKTTTRKITMCGSMCGSIKEENINKESNSKISIRSGGVPPTAGKKSIKETDTNSHCSPPPKEPFHISTLFCSPPPPAACVWNCYDDWQEGYF